MGSTRARRGFSITLWHPWQVANGLWTPGFRDMPNIVLSYISIPRNTYKERKWTMYVLYIYSDISYKENHFRKYVPNLFLTLKNDLENAYLYGRVVFFNFLETWSTTAWVCVRSFSSKIPPRLSLTLPQPVALHHCGVKLVVSCWNVKTILALASCLI